MWGMIAFLVLFVDILMVGVILIGHLVRSLNVHVSKGITFTEDGARTSMKKEAA